MNDNALSFKIASEMTSTACTTRMGITSGRMWRETMCPLPAPMARARRTNLRDFTARVCERTTRAVVVQPSKPMTKMMLNREGLVSATMTTINGRSGMTSMMSVKRIRKVSQRPPKNPATSPNSPPMKIEMNAAKKPTVSETRAPYTKLEKTSCPASSVPNQ
ncbi:MAG: hypothetical protein HND47_14395 [Chloroflexi bacterium]|nr:hypothetical protein [Chloroflexota bacterium]